MKYLNHVRNTLSFTDIHIFHLKSTIFLTSWNLEKRLYFNIQFVTFIEFLKVFNQCNSNTLEEMYFEKNLWCRIYTVGSLQFCNDSTIASMEAGQNRPMSVMSMTPSTKFVKWLKIKLCIWHMVCIWYGRAFFPVPLSWIRSWVMHLM